MSATNRHALQLYGYLGLFAALLYFLSLDLKYRFALFAMEDGLAFILNQIGFVFAMLCLLMMLFGMWQTNATGSQPAARLALATLIIGWMIQIIGEGAILLSYDGISRLIWIGESLVMIGALIGGVEIVISGSWRGWRCFVILLLGLLVLLMLRMRSVQSVTLLLEAQIAVGWFFVALALATFGGASGLQDSAEIAR